MSRSIRLGLPLSLSLVLVSPWVSAQQRPAGPIRPVTPQDVERVEKGEAPPAADASGKFAPSTTALIDEAKAHAQKADDKAAADALQRATKVTKLSTDERKALEAGITSLSASKHAESEVHFLKAKALSPGSPLALAAIDIASSRRLTSEKTALATLEISSDPRVQAAVLRDALLLDPKGKAPQPAIDALTKRARAASIKGDDANVAQSLDAMAMLENRGAEMTTALEKAGALFAKGHHVEAEIAYRPLVESIDGTSSKAAALGRELARERRVATLRKDIDDAKKTTNVIRQSKAVKQLLELVPQDKAAQEMARKLKTGAVDARVQRAKTATAEGNLGIAWVELSRAQELDAGNTKVTAERTALEARLRERTDLIVRATRLTRGDKASKEACKGLEDRIVERVMEEGSQRTDLGGYILSKAWTEAVDRKDPRAPIVSSDLTMKIERCESGGATGKVLVSWVLELAGAGRKPTASGQAEAAVPQGFIPRDEQDGEGNNVKKALATRASKAILDSIQGSRAANETWLLLVAEHAVEQKDHKGAADAFARLTVKQRGYDTKRVEAVKAWLDAEVE